MKTITFIGVGGIGKPMAERLIETGFAITVCDLNEAALEGFRKRGARTISRAAEGTEADAILVMVANDAQVKAQCSARAVFWKELIRNARPSSRS